MRRSLVNRLGIFLLGAIAFLVPCFLYPPLDLDGILIFFGVIFFITIGLAMWAERRSIRSQEVELLKHVFQSLVLIPWLFAFCFLPMARSIAPRRRTTKRVWSAASLFPAFCRFTSSSSLRGETAMPSSVSLSRARISSASR